MTLQESEAISQIYAARGYLVTARYKLDGPCEIGEILMGVHIRNGSFIDQPLRVVAETTRQDFIDQAHYFGSYHIDPDYDRFYRVESD
jgi:hypothetical protein